MIISMSDMMVVTNRHLCMGDFLRHMESVAAAHPKAVILREKDLDAADYRQMAESVLSVCAAYDTPCILHGFVSVAIALRHRAVHVPFSGLRAMSAAEKAAFDVLGVSCHSCDESQEAERLGCSYITAGHIFHTDCKRGICGRGLDFLKDICRSVSVPVYAIGGIAPENIQSVRQVGAAGGCVMSGAMRCSNAAAYLQAFQEVGIRGDEA